ncbi:MAG: hypothetical protein ACYTF0_09000, partial [Planctomycetota bacterium]
MSRDILAAAPGVRRLIYRTIMRCGPLLPLRLTQWGSYLTSWVAWWQDARGRAVVADNLAPLVANRRRRQHLVRLNFRNFCLSCAENLHLHQLPKRMLDRFAIIDPWQHRTNGMLRGPAILCTVHANFELAPALLHQSGAIDHIHTISLSHGDPVIDQLFA